MPIISEEVTAEAIKPVAPVRSAQPPTEQPGDAKHQMNRVHYRTCMALLMLETYYRFLPGTGSAR